MDDVGTLSSSGGAGGAGAGSAAGAGAASGAGGGVGGAGDGGAFGKGARGVLGAGGRRRDGRGLDQLRPFSAEQGLLNRADGSARLSAGDSCVLAGVYGPMKPKATRLERPDRAVIKVIVKPQDGMAGPADVEMGRTLAGCLETVVLTKAHPRTIITVVVQTVTVDGSILALAINCSMLALMDAGTLAGDTPMPPSHSFRAGVPMLGVLSAVSCGITPKGAVCMDLLRTEELDVEATLTLCESSSASGVVGMVMAGAAEEEQLDRAVARAKRGCAAVLAFLRYAASQKVVTSMHVELAEEAARTAAEATPPTDGDGDVDMGS